MLIIFSYFFVNLTCFHRELQVFFQISDVTKNMSRMIKRVSKAGKVDPGNRVTLPVKFACKPDLPLTHLLG